MQYYVKSVTDLTMQAQYQLDVYVGHKRRYLASNISAETSLIRWSRAYCADGAFLVATSDDCWCTEIEIVMKLIDVC